MVHEGGAPEQGNSLCPLPVGVRVRVQGSAFRAVVTALAVREASPGPGRATPEALSSGGAGRHSVLLQVIHHYSSTINILMILICVITTFLLLVL